MKVTVTVSDCPSVAVTVRIRVWSPGSKSRYRRRNDKEPTQSKLVTDNNIESEMKTPVYQHIQASAGSPS